MTVEVAAGKAKFEADTYPIVVRAEKTVSCDIMVFYCNGIEYKFHISEKGKLAVTK